MTNRALERHGDPGRFKLGLYSSSNQNLLEKHMTGLRSSLRLIFLLQSTLLFGQGATRANQIPALCKVESLPSDIQNRLKKEYSCWKIQRSEEHTSELQSPCNLVCRLLLEKKKKKKDK